MKRIGFYPRLAFQSMNKNRALYLPYLLMSMLMIAVDYIMSYLCTPSVIAAMGAGDMVTIVLALGHVVIAVFSAVFLFYCNTFLVGRRMKEFGLYNVLGMGKRNIAFLMFWETLLTAGIALVGGMLFGISLSRLAELIMIRLLQADITNTISINWTSLLRTVEIFGVIYGIILLVNLLKMRISNPMELLRSENAGERPPKANWLVALLGVILLGAGYYVAVTVESPITALFFFFVAVLLVIAGTFLLFISGSVTLCKLLMKNKRYYYRTNHFISLSSMAFRMKRNGGGLAAICILCTMVLVTLSSTLCLYAGIEDMSRILFPSDLTGKLTLQDRMPYSQEKQDALFQQVLSDFESEGYASENVEYLSTLISCGKIVDANVIREEPWDNELRVGEMVFVYYPLSSYEALTGETVDLAPGELLCYALRSDYRGNTLSLYGGETYTLRKIENIPDYFVSPYYRVSYDCLILFVDDYAAFSEKLIARSDTTISYIHFFLDVPGHEDDLAVVEGEFCRIFGTTMKSIDEQANSHLTVQTRSTRQEMYSLFGSLFFLGLVLGGVFSLTAMLIIYYKQISEGYEDAGRFAMMRKVGLDDQQIHRSINSQVLTVFFAPLIMTGLHGLFAMPMVLLMLRSFGMNNASLFYEVAGICFVVFALLYTAVYFITSRTYYRIVR